jgi:hypothetical protein
MKINYQLKITKVWRPVRSIFSYNCPILYETKKHLELKQLSKEAQYYQCQRTAYCWTWFRASLIQFTFSILKPHISPILVFWEPMFEVPQPTSCSYFPLSPIRTNPYSKHAACSYGTCLNCFRNAGDSICQLEDKTCNFIVVQELVLTISLFVF